MNYSLQLKLVGVAGCISVSNTSMLRLRDADGTLHSVRVGARWKAGDLQGYCTRTGAVVSCSFDEHGIVIEGSQRRLPFGGRYDHPADVWFMRNVFPTSVRENRL